MTTSLGIQPARECGRPTGAEKCHGSFPATQGRGVSDPKTWLDIVALGGPPHKASADDALSKRHSQRNHSNRRAPVLTEARQFHATGTRWPQAPG
jgi:hypothetical protein